MKLIRGIKHVPAFSKGSVVAIGNFDGVHLGHQALLSQLKQESIYRQLPSVVFLFEPQAAEFFLHDKAPARLSSLREKCLILASLGIDYVYCLPFTQKIATMSATYFAHNVLFSVLNTRYLLIGEDFRFGYQRQGDANTLKALAIPANCLVETFANFTFDGFRVSSTKIREALSLGHLSLANKLIGRPYSLCGRVIKGAGLGRQWGIPTANLSRRRLRLALQGVFRVQVQLSSGLLVNGVANMGCRPTVDGTTYVLEVHLFDYHTDLYGQYLQVYFLEKIRDEIKFSSKDALINQIFDDIALARAGFESGHFEFNRVNE